MKNNSLLTLTLILFFSALLLSNVESKFVRKTFKTSNIQKKGWEYITKMGINIGEGKYEAVFRMLDSQRKRHLIAEGEDLSVNMLILVDTEYETINSEMTCQDVKNLAKSKKGITLNKDGTFTKPIESSLHQSVRQHVWYFLIASCDGFSNTIANNNIDIQVELNLTDSDGSKFSSEENGLMTLYGLTVLVFTGFAVMLYGKYFKLRQRDWPQIILLISFTLLYFSTFSYFCHLMIYSSDGQGSTFLKIVSSLCNITSQFTITVLLVLLSWGWTINYDNLENVDLMIPLVGLSAVVHIIIIGLGYLNEDTDTRYNDYSGFVGFILVTFRFVSFGYFIYCIRQTINTTRIKVKEYAEKLQYLGGFYFLSIPVSVIIGSCLAYYLQHRFISIATLIFQMFAIGFLAISFLAKESGYQKVAMKNRTELPSAFGSKFD